MKPQPVLMISVLVLLIAYVPAYATTIYVDDDAPGDPGPGDPSVSDPLEDGSAAHPFDAIQEGIDAAVVGDTVLVKDGTYTGDGNRDLDFGGKAITVASANGPDVTIIDCTGPPEHPHRAFHFHSGETAQSTVEGFGIRNGSATSRGGGILCVRSSPTVARCWIQDCWGGGIHCDNASPTITDCIISRCVASVHGYGSGVHCRNGSSPIIRGCTIIENSARVGAGVFCERGSPTLSKCVVSANTAGASGGGIFCGSHTSVAIRDCAISDNSAGRDGGGIFCIGGVGAISNCIISSNTAGHSGGGIACWNSDSEIQNSVIHRNSAGEQGGAIRCISGRPKITNCTISDNSCAKDGGAIHCRYYSRPRVANCVLWGNHAPNGHEIYLASVFNTSYLRLRHCNVQGGAAEAHIESGCTLDMDASNIDADPLFADAAGGDYRLLYGSPCIDAGTSNGAPERDIAGASRRDERTIPNTGGGDEPWYDIGAYEFYRGRRLGQLDPHPGKGLKKD